MAKWTERTIAKLPVPSAERGAHDYPDPLLKGLYLTVQPSGVRSWSVKYRIGGRQRRYTIGRFPGIGIAAARKQARTVLEGVSGGRDPQADKLAARTGAVADGFVALLKTYVATYTRVRNSSWEDGADKLGLDLNWYVKLQLTEGKDVPLEWHIKEGSVADQWQKLSVHQIDRRMVASAVAGAVSRQGPIAANRLLSALGGFFTWCVGQGILPVSPAKGIPKPAPENIRERELSDAELAMIWRAAAAIPAPYSTFAQLLMLLGQRRTETSLIARSQLRTGSADEDFSGTIWRVPSGIAKSRIAHDVPIPAMALELIERQPKHEGDLILPSPRTGGPIGGWNAIKDRIEEQLDGTITEQWQFHDFRRTMATGLQRLGFPPYIAEVTINHKIPASSDSGRPYLRYTYLKEKAAALDAWAAHISRIAAASAPA